MNAKLIFHIALTETRKNVWFILVFWLFAFFFPEEGELHIILGFVVVALLAQGDHIIRPTALWQRLPISLWECITAKISLLFVWIILPILIQQGWVAHVTLLSPSATAWMQFENVSVPLLFASLALAVTSMPQRWRTLIPTAITGALFLYAALWIFDKAVDMPSPHSVNGTLNQNRVSNPALLWIAYPLATLLFWGFLAWHRRQLCYRDSFAALAAIFVLASTALITIYGSMAQVSKKKSPNAVYLSQGKEEKSGQQPFYKNISISGVEPGAFVQQKKLTIDGGKRSIHKGNYDFNQRIRLAALEQTFEIHSTLFRANSNQLYDTTRFNLGREPKFKFRKALASAPAANSLTRVHVKGDNRKWIKILEIPIENGKFRSSHDISAYLEISEQVSNNGKNEYKLTLYRPALTFTPKVKQNLFPGGWGGLGDTVVLMHNRELGEHVIPATRQTSNNTVSGSRIASREVIFEAPENDAWKILWPEGDAAEKWLAGAKLEIYTTEYLGKFEDEIYLSTE